MNYNIKDIDSAIMLFRKDYLFLSNFYEGNVFEYKGMRFSNTEAAFHSQKCVPREEEFEMLRPMDSKRLGRRINLRRDWEEVKEKVMYDICYAKFTQDEELRMKLLKTRERELVEGNSHGDRCWGMTFDQKTNQWLGENKLGIVLMKLREDLSDRNYCYTQDIERGE